MFFLNSQRNLFVDEAYSYLTTTQYPLTYWFAAVPILFILSVFSFYKCAKASENKNRILATIYTIAGVLLFTFSNINAKDAHPMLFYTLLHYWTLLFGNSILIMRSLSFIFGLAAISALWRYCKTFHDEKVAIIATILMTISSTQTHFFSEIRQYSILIFLGILATHELRLIIEKKKDPWLYSILVIIMAYTHYFSAIFLLAHLVVFLINKTSWTTLRKAIMPIILTCIPLGLYFLQQISRIVTMYLKPPTALSWFSSIGYSINYPDNLLGTTNSLLLIIITAIMLILIIITAINKDDKWTWTEIALATLPQLILIIIAFFYNIYNPRYDLSLLWLIPVLIAIALTQIQKKHGTLIATTLTGGFIILILCITLNSSTSTEIKDCTQTLIQNAQHSNITILHETPFSSLPQRYYTRNYPEYRTIWLALNYTRPMIQSMNGDTTNRNDIYFFKQDLPHFNYYYEHDHYINTENMTLLMECNGLRLWKNTPAS